VRETNSAYGSQAHTSAFVGRVRQAHEEFRRGIQMALQGHYDEVAAQLAIEDAEAHAIAGQCGEARSEMTAGLERSRDNGTLERASRALALCGASAEVQALTAELARRFPESTLTMRVSLPVAAATLALQRGEARRALDALEQASPYEHAPSSEFWPLYLRAQAHLQLKDPAGAAPLFQEIVDRRGEAPVSMFYPLAYLGLARAAVLRGDTAVARAAYDRFLDLWRGADPDVQPLNDAKIERGRLGAAPPH
jgi:tetratricopeptide (TPR) repeat protein